jgi:hypothetical protein
MRIKVCMCLICGLSLCWAVASVVEAGSPVGTAFTYQGRLRQNGMQINGLPDTASFRPLWRSRS